jgi:hypothetical protein
MDGIGKGSYSKVKKVIRRYKTDEGVMKEDKFAMKVRN